MTPLYIKKIVPNDWDQWWKLWNQYAGVVQKTYNNHNNEIGVWKGLDLVTKVNIKLIYTAPHAPSHPVIDDLVSQVNKHIPIILFKIRVIENLYEVPYHSDHNHPKDELRCFLWNNYTDSVWSFKYNNIIRKLQMPEDSNTFYYKDYPLQHSSIYCPNKGKGIMLIYGALKKEFSNLLSKSVNHYKNLAWVL